MKPAKTYSYLLLVIALLFTQLGGLVHGISHTLEQHKQDQTQAHEKLCDLCAAYAQVGNALSSSPPVFTSSVLGIVFAAPLLTPIFPAALLAFAARAPPLTA